MDSKTKLKSSSVFVQCCKLKTTSDKSVYLPYFDPQCDSLVFKRHFQLSVLWVATKYILKIFLLFNYKSVFCKLSKKFIKQICCRYLSDEDIFFKLDLKVDSRSVDVDWITVDIQSASLSTFFNVCQNNVKSCP